MGKERRIKTEFQGKIFTLQFKTGEKFTADYGRYPESIIRKLLEYGIKQKFSDYRVGDKLSPSGRVTAWQELDAQLQSGEFVRKISREERERKTFEKLQEFADKYANLPKKQKDLLQKMFPEQVEAAEIFLKSRSKATQASEKAES